MKPEMTDGAHWRMAKAAAQRAVQLRDEKRYGGAEELYSMAAEHAGQAAELAPTSELYDKCREAQELWAEKQLSMGEIQETTVKLLALRDKLKGLVEAAETVVGQITDESCMICAFVVGHDSWCDVKTLEERTAAARALLGESGW